jgi:uncharacterized spore protein YtfJ
VCASVRPVLRARDYDPLVDETAPIEVTGGPRLLKVSEAAARVLGARLCFGDPVRQGERAIVPVASVSTTGGFGFGTTGGDAQSDGGGWGGVFAARPAGFIEISASGTSFHRIVTTADVLQVAGAVVMLASIFGRARRRRRRAAQVVSKQP